MGCTGVLPLPQAGHDRRRPLRPPITPITPVNPSAIFEGSGTSLGTATCPISLTFVLISGPLLSVYWPEINTKVSEIGQVAVNCLSVVPSLLVTTMLKPGN